MFHILIAEKIFWCDSQFMICTTVHATAQNIMNSTSTSPDHCNSL